MAKHKTAEQLLEEVDEIVREFKVYEAYKEGFLKSLKEVETDYKNKHLSYIQYERKCNSVLKGKTKQGWVDYYNAYEYSLLKKIEFILSQVFTIVYDDESYAKLAVSKETSPAPVKHETKKIEVFNIDNELLKLKGLLEKKYPSTEVKAAVRKFDFKVPELEELKADIKEAEERAAAKVQELAAAKAEQAERVKQAELAKPAKQVKQAEPLQKPVAVTVKKKISIKLPRISFPKLNFSPKEGTRELATGYNAVKNACRAFLKHLPFIAKASKIEPYAKAASKRDALISFSDMIDSSTEKPKKVPQKKPEHTVSLFARIKQKFSPKKQKLFVEDIISMERISKKTGERKSLAAEEAGIAFGWFSPKRFLLEFTGKFRKKQEPILGESTKVPVHMKKLGEMRKRLYHEERLTGFDSTLLAQEAKRIKRLLEVEKREVYQGSSLGLIANVTVRKISLFFVNNFPQFFGYLYNALRAANVKVLSNTYVNIMILVSILMTISTFFLLLIFFFILNHPIYQIVLRSFIFSIIAGGLTATIFYVYPFMKIRERRRKTTTNLPFAINHMSAVSTSGVSPARMFELISASEEYEEVGVEIKKIVDFTNIFGYDLLTAIRAVAATTPSLVFKKFLEGMISTIETGGDLVSYFRQQADEAALTYKLERQRYNETVSTYSDIYTGVLIAAPLFFIAAMAMVNLLGGTLGGLGVGVVMALGAYVVIPLMNIGFIFFLQMTQPEV